MVLPTLSTLKASGMEPRVHGNGFLQLDLTPTTRLHVWDEGLPKQTLRTSIHDHLFGINSTVICGALLHTEFDIEAVPFKNANYNVFVAEAQEGTNNTILVPTGESVILHKVASSLMLPGTSYYFPPFKFHDTDYRYGTTATIMEKVDKQQGQSRVLVPLGGTPDNDFDREGFDPEELWPFVERALELAYALERD